MNYVRSDGASVNIGFGAGTSPHPQSRFQDRPRDLREREIPDRGQMQDVRCGYANGTPSILVDMSNTIGAISKAPDQNVIQKKASGFQLDLTV